MLFSKKDNSRSNLQRVRKVIILLLLSINNMNLNNMTIKKHTEKKHIKVGMYHTCEILDEKEFLLSLSMHLTKGIVPSKLEFLNLK